MHYALNWQFGWCLILLAFLGGSVIGMFFHRDDFLGGYGSFRRRVLRLGHVAMAALGMMNVLFAVSGSQGPTSSIASTGFVAGAILMPAVCFLTAWRKAFRILFPLPVVALVVAVICTILGGHS